MGHTFLDWWNFVLRTGQVFCALLFAIIAIVHMTLKKKDREKDGDN